MTVWDGDWVRFRTPETDGAEEMAIRLPMLSMVTIHREAAGVDRSGTIPTSWVLRIHNVHPARLASRLHRPPRSSLGFPADSGPIRCVGQ